MNESIREVKRDDLAQLLALYAQLHGDIYDLADARLNAIWERILSDPGSSYYRCG